jgi:hypothetical protein
VPGVSFAIATTSPLAPELALPSRPTAKSVVALPALLTVRVLQLLSVSSSLFLRLRFCSGHSTRAHHRQICVCEHRQRDMPIPPIPTPHLIMPISPIPTPHLIMIQSDFAFGALKALFNRPSCSGHLDHLFERGLLRRLHYIVGKICRIADAAPK